MKKRIHMNSVCLLLPMPGLNWKYYTLSLCVNIAQENIHKFKKYNINKA